MDRVKIVGLKSAKGLTLNGRIGTVRAISGENDGTSNPYVAKMPDGRYKVDVEFDETIGREERPGRVKGIAEKQTVSLRRANLIMEDVGIGTLARGPEGREILNLRGLGIKSTAEM